MLHLYRRHKDGCKFGSNPYHKGCRCPIWMRGVLDAVPVRKAMDLRSWEKAEAKKRELESPPREQEAAPEPLTFERTRDLFIAKLQGENREPDTVPKIPAPLQTA